MKRPILYLVILLSLWGCKDTTIEQGKVKNPMMEINTSLHIATFAGGCFWCVEADFKKLPGVVRVVSGYTGGYKENPTYEEVSSGRTGHVEAIQVFYNPDEIAYEQLLTAFWRHIDPTDGGGQFADRGAQYRSVIFYHDEEQRELAEKSREGLRQSRRFAKPIVTEIVKAGTFYKAEAYHQDYDRKNPLRYQFYRQGSGRDRFLKEVWGKDMTGASQRPYQKLDNATLSKKLTPLQYDVTQKNGTEPPFQNPYWNNKRDGIYVDAVSGEPLFSSLDKFDSGTGWPSFTRPLEPDYVVEKEDRGLLVKRMEVRSRQADSHLGHVFPDGPKPAGLRYCINSAALKFIPREDLEKEGYGKYINLFGEKK